MTKICNCIIFLCIFVVVTALVYFNKFGSGRSEESVNESIRSEKLTPSDQSKRKYQYTSVSAKGDERGRDLEAAQKVLDSRARVIRREFGGLDQAILGGRLPVDSRAAKQVTENRLLSVVGAKSKLSATQRVNTLGNLSALSREEIETIYDAMQSDQVPENLTRENWNWVVDVMMTSLRTQGADPTEVSERLASLFHEESVNLTVRDYALQHLGHIRHEGGNIELINETLSIAIDRNEGTLAGTALLALDNASTAIDAQTSVNPVRAKQAFKIASSKEYSLQSRVTALQVAATHKAEGISELAKQIIEDETTPHILKISAQAVLSKTTK